MNIKESLHHLNSLLPLKSRQDSLDPVLRDLHRQILLSFARTGQPLSRTQLAAELGEDRVDEALQRLAAADLIVLSADQQKITGAYPFTVEQRVHQVDVDGKSVHAMCALDALSIAPMCEVATRIRSQCHVSGTPVEILMDEDRVLTASPDDVHIGIRWQSTSGCAAKNLCMEMVYLRDAGTAAEWQQQDSENIDIYTLAEAVEFGSAFFKPLLESK